MYVCIHYKTGFGILYLLHNLLTTAYYYRLKKLHRIKTVVHNFILKIKNNE